MTENHVFTAIRRRYDAAFHAYNAVVTRNASFVLSGGHPSLEERDEETRKRDVLESARRAMLAALPRPA